MASVFDHDGNTIGSISHEDGAIIARDIDGHELGRYGTSLEAVSACFTAWREPADCDEESLFERIAAKLKAGTND